MTPLERSLIEVSLMIERGQVTLGALERLRLLVLAGLNSAPARVAELAERYPEAFRVLCRPPNPPPRTRVLPTERGNERRNGRGEHADGDVLYVGRVRVDARGDRT